MNATTPWTVTWTEELSVGIPEIDDEHKRFVILLNNLNAAIRERASAMALEALMQDVFADVREHFRHEEQLFAQYGYEGHDRHARQHEQIIRKFEEMSDTFRGNISESERIQIGLDIKNILVSHLINEDMKYRDMQRASPTAGEEQE